MGFWWSIVVLLMLCLNGLDAYSYQTYDLNNHCGSTISLPCRRKSSYRAGTFTYQNYPSGNCSVNVMVDGPSSDCSYEDYAIYFNVKYLSLYQGDSVIINETKYTYPYTVSTMKTYAGMNPYTSYNPTSVDQFRTSYSKRPYMTITFNKLARETRPTATSIKLDYSVIFESADSSDTYCSALGGYVLDDLICESGDRVNCPRSYYYTTGMNYVFSKDQGYQSACYLGDGEIAGIVLGSIFGFAFFVGLVACACRQHNNRIIHQHVVPASSCQGGPVVISSTYPSYPVQRSGYNGTFAGAPPSYDYVGPATYPVPGPAGANVMPQPPHLK